MAVRSADRFAGVVENLVQDVVYRIRPALIIFLRTILGIIFAWFFSMTSIAVAWGLFVFSSSQSIDTWLILKICAAGTGAGMVSMLAWVNIDRDTRALVMAMVAASLVGGLAGGWAGYNFAAPVPYTAAGSSLMSNLVMLVFGLARNKLTALDKMSPRRAPMVNGTDATEYRSVNR